MPAFQGACLAIAHCREFCGRRRLGTTGRVHVAVGPSFANRGLALICNSWPCLFDMTGRGLAALVPAVC